jgi:F-type H+-transporting ATPase subunit delta
VRSITIARNYAETLFELARRSGESIEAWGDLLDVTAAALGTPRIEVVLMSPRVPTEQKVRIVSDALKGAPRPFVLFLAAVIRRGRQVLLPTIADEYRAMLDRRLGRVRAGVTTARPVDEARQAEIVAKLSAGLGKEVIAGFAVDPAILGGTIVKIGDQVHDGSVRKRLGQLRRQLIAGT